jgi:hypothetical protein
MRDLHKTARKEKKKKMVDAAQGRKEHGLKPVRYPSGRST